MARHIWSVLCTKGSIDSQTNNVSLFNVTEKFAISGRPPEPEAIAVIPGPMELVTLSMRSNVAEPETVMARIALLAPNGERTEGSTFAIEMVGNFIRNRHVLRINALPLRGSGIYEFVVEFQTTGTNDWIEVARIPLEIEFQGNVPAAE